MRHSEKHRKAARQVAGPLSLAAALTLSLFHVPALRAQEPIRVRVDLVNAEVTVTDAQGNFVEHLMRKNFRILDEGVEQPVTNFAPIDAPAQILVLVETGPAVYLIHRQHLLAAYELLQGLAPNDRVALATYDQSAHLALSFTANKEALAQALGGLRYGLGMAELNLYASLATVLDWLSSVPGRKAVVLLSTGLDTSGAAGWELLQTRLAATDAVILPVVLGGELRTPEKGKQRAPQTPGPGGLSFERADRGLDAIAKATGGQVYFPQRADEFAGIYRQIAAQLRHLYSLGFAPSKRDGLFHKIEVQVVDSSGRVLGPGAQKTSYRIHTRKGYVAPDE